MRGIDALLQAAQKAVTFDHTTASAMEYTKPKSAHAGPRGKLPYDIPTPTKRDLEIRTDAEEKKARMGRTRKILHSNSEFDVESESCVLDMADVHGGQKKMHVPHEAIATPANSPYMGDWVKYCMCHILKNAELATF